MWFKLTYRLDGMRRRRADDPPASVDLTPRHGPHAQMVIWTRTFPPEMKRASQLCCDAIIERRLRIEIENMLLDLEKGFLPAGEPEEVILPYRLAWDAEIGQDRRIPDKWSIPFEILPVRLQNVINEVRSGLADTIRDFVKALRWMQLASGSHAPFGEVGLYWSTDRIAWHDLPFAISLRALDSRPVGSTPSEFAQVASLIAKGGGEPLGHEIIREALDMASSNPRSALLVGVSALETGLKEFIQAIAPETTPLLEKLPSPPALTILQEVIPALVPSSKTAFFPIAREDADTLRKWVQIRNKVAHGSHSKIDGNDLVAFLEWVRRLLYKLDVSRGCEWAAEFADPRLPTVSVRYRGV